MKTAAMRTLERAIAEGTDKIVIKVINPEKKDRPAAGPHKAQERNAQGQKGTQKSGARALGQKAQGPRRTMLEWALREMKRLPKPRGMGDIIDEPVWDGAREKAMTEFQAEYGIECLNAYYDKMCSVGQRLAVKEIHRKTQSLYDYRVGKIISRENRRLK